MERRQVFLPSSSEQGRPTCSEDHARLLAIPPTRAGAAPTSVLPQLVGGGPLPLKTLHAGHPCMQAMSSQHCKRKAPV